MRSPLAKARYLGSAKSGVEHWYAQRLSAAALVPLGLWFAYGATVLVRADYATAVTWISDPLNAALFILFLSCLYYHALIGLQVVVEDYVPRIRKENSGTGHHSCIYHPARTDVGAQHSENHSELTL